MHKLLALQLIIVTMLLGISSGNVPAAARHANELLDMSCSRAEHCKQFAPAGVNASCIDGQCRCSTAADATLVECTPQEVKVNNIVGGPCPCAFTNAECNAAEQICYCAPDYMPSKDGRRCLQKRLTLGELCELDEQCYSNTLFAKCEHKCVCGNDYIAVNGTCVAALTAPERVRCHDDAACVERFDEHARCLLKQDRCGCAEQFVVSNHTTCVAAANYNEACVRSAQCQLTLGKGAECHNNVCVCNGHHTLYQPTDDAEKRTCAPKPAYGQYCYNNSDCYQYQRAADDQGMICHLSECRCKENYHIKDHWDCTSGSMPQYLMTNMCFGLLATALVSIIL